MNYFDSDMSKSTNTVVYFDWKAVIYIYVCGQMLHTIYATKFEQTIIHQHAHLRRESQSHAPAHVLMRLYTQSINRSFCYKAKEGRHVRIFIIYIPKMCAMLIWNIRLGYYGVMTIDNATSARVYRDGSYIPYRFYYIC
jgi:hypothetical protein